MRPRRSQLKPPARARSTRARLLGIVRACCLDSGAALATLAFAPLGDPAARPLAVFAALAALALLAMLVRSLTSRASRSMIARFPFLGCFSEPLVFSKNDTPSTRKPRFLRSGGSQNGAKMTPKLEPKWSQNQAPVRGASGRASGSDFGGSWRIQEGPQRLPKSAPGAPRSAPGGPK